MSKSPIVGVCLLLLSLAACEASEPEMKEDGDFIFRLSLPPALSVDTRGDDIAGTTITNVWVFQFNESNKLIVGKAYGDAAISPIGDGSNTVLLQVATGGFSNVNSTFWVIANFGEDQASLKALKEGVATVADLQKIAINYDNYTNKPSYLVSNAIKYQKQGSETEDKAVILAPLNYAFAYITVKWANQVTSPAKFTLHSVKAFNLPATLAVDTRGGGTSVYPASAAGSYIVATESTVGSGINANIPLDFYMPENLRGMGCGTTFQQKNLSNFGPTITGQAPVLGADGVPQAGGTLDNCTFIDLEGSYQYPNSTGTGPVDGAVAVRYRLYLGGNLMNDYNIRRGFHYTITVQISGINSGDVRVTITDGAVVVFDKVETITNKVEFR